MLDCIREFFNTIYEYNKVLKKYAEAKASYKDCLATKKDMAEYFKKECDRHKNDLVHLQNNLKYIYENYFKDLTFEALDFSQISKGKLTLDFDKKFYVSGKTILQAFVDYQNERRSHNCNVQKISVDFTDGKKTLTVLIDGAAGLPNQISAQKYNELISKRRILPLSDPTKGDEIKINLLDMSSSQLNVIYEQFSREISKGFNKKAIYEINKYLKRCDSKIAKLAKENQDTTKVAQSKARYQRILACLEPDNKFEF